MSRGGWWRWPLLAAAATALLSWPLAYRYTSLGCEREVVDGDTIVATYWRLRWPGDGSVMLLRIVERTPHDHAPDAFDLGARFLHPAIDPGAVTAAERSGFWWRDIDATRDAVPTLVAGCSTASIIGVPHWLLALLTTLAATAALRPSRREGTAPGTSSSFRPPVR